MRADCNKRKAILTGGKIGLTCSGACYRQWDAAGRVFKTQNCQLCGQEHGVVYCPKMGADNKARMTELFGYVDEFSWWHNVNNIAKAREFINNLPSPQNAQRAINKAFTHGNARIGPVTRRIYFDLGGEYDLIDNQGFEELTRAINNGNLPNAQIISPQHLGFKDRGVPIDVACATGKTTSTVVWIQRWIAATVRVQTDAGRSITLTQVQMHRMRTQINKTTDLRQEDMCTVRIQNNPAARQRQTR